MYAFCKQLYQPKYWSFCGHEADFDNLIVLNNCIESYYHTIKTQITNAHPNVAGFTEIMSRMETLKKSEYESAQIGIDTQGSTAASQLSVICEASSSLRSWLKKESESIRGEQAWSSTILMRYLHKSKGLLETSNSGEITDRVIILEDEFLEEHNDEITASFSRPTKHEDTVKDILAQENLCMNLHELVNLKKEEILKAKMENGRVKKEKSTLAQIKKSELNNSRLGIKNEGTLEEQSIIASSQDSVLSKTFGANNRKTKHEEGYESTPTSQSPSQFMNDLDITRKRVDIAERILLYAESDNENNLIKDSQSSQLIPTQGTIREECNELMKAISKLS